MVDQFFLVFLLIILITRLFLFIKPVPAFTIKGLRTHHWMYGIVMVLIGLYFHSLVLYAIGLGLFTDELTYILIGGKNHSDNYSAKSLVGTILFIVLIYFIRDVLISFI